VYRQTDFITNLFLAVLDYRSTEAGVLRALEHYRRYLWDTIRTMPDLKRFLLRYPNDSDGNLQAGLDLWGCRAKRRMSELRSLIRYFDARGVVTQEFLVHWAKNSSYGDFEGRVPGLGREVYEAILMRQGLGALRPAEHLREFVSTAAGRLVEDEDLLYVIERAARALGITSKELDHRILEHHVEAA
jgi:hypothetical protein